MKSRKWKQSKYFGKTKEEIKQQWNQNGKEASEAGTKLHYDIECFYNGKKIDNDSIEYKQFLSFNEKIRFKDMVNPSRESIVSDFII